MTNITRKGLWIIVLSSLFVATFIFFCVATEGFHNWNGASWFEYWGKGKPKATVSEQTDQPAEQSVMPLNLPHMFHDSDDATTTVDVKRLDTPDCKFVTGYGVSPIWDNFGFMISTQGFWGTHVEVNLCYTKNGMTTSELVGTLQLSYETPNISDSTSTSNEIGISIGDIIHEDSYLYETAMEQSNGYLFVEVHNVSYGEYLESESTFEYIFVPECYRVKDVGITKIGEFANNDLTFEIPLLYPYSCASGSMGAPGSYDCYEILITNGPLESATHFNASSWKALNSFLGVSDLPDGFLDTHTVTVENSAISLSEDESKYVIDLTRLNFVDTLTAGYIYVKPRKTNVYLDYEVVFGPDPYRFKIDKLDAPTNIAYSNGKLTWNAVSYAQGYCIFEGNFSWTVDTNEFDLSDKSFAAGEHTFRIRALGNVGKQLATAENGIMLSAFNASANITELVTLTYNIDGDTITKFVPKDSTFGGYTYEVKIKGKEFGGWYYDSGFSRPVVSSDKVTSDMVIYARLSDKKVTERQLSWWELHKWQVLIPCFVVAGLLVIAAVVVTVRKKKAAA